MEKQSEAERVARTESLFREVNERIAEAARRFGANDAEFVCECSDPACTKRLSATLAEYERVRGDGATFLLALGHEDRRAESVVELDPGHEVVEKDDPDVAPLVRELDPRAA